MTRIEQLLAKVVSTDGCWLWGGVIDRFGYGRIGGNLAHRQMYLAVGRESPEGLQLDHTCRTRACVNPDHLEPVTKAENQRRGMLGELRRPICPKGHPYDGQNTKYYKGHRFCRACNRLAVQRYRAAKGLL